MFPIPSLVHPDPFLISNLPTPPTPASWASSKKNIVPKSSSAWSPESSSSSEAWIRTRKRKALRLTPELTSLFGALDFLIPVVIPVLSVTLDLLVPVIIPVLSITLDFLVVPIELQMRGQKGLEEGGRGKTYFVEVFPVPLLTAGLDFLVPL